MQECLIEKMNGMSGDQSVFGAKEEVKKNIVEIDDAQYILESKSSNHIRHLSTQLTQLREDSQLCDAVLVVKGTRMKVHRVVLAACSNYFKAMFTADMAKGCSLQEIDMVNFEASTVEALVKFCYSGKINISDTNVLSILHTARTLQLHQVEELCYEFLKGRLEPSSPMVMRVVTDSNSFPEAPLCTDENALHNFENVVNTEKSHKLLVDQLTELISAGELNARLMEQVAVAVLQWIKADLSARKPFLSQVMQQMGLCSPEFGNDNTATEGLSAKADAACGDLFHKTKISESSERPGKDTLSTQPKDSSKSREVIYVVGGSCSDANNADDLATVECFDPEGAYPVWQHVPSMKTQRGGVGVGVVDNLLYAIGGFYGKQLSSVERFDPVTNDWSGDVAPMPTRRNHVGVGALDGFLYAAGGYDGTNRLSVVERYDPRRNQWIRVAPMSTNRNLVSVSVLCGCLYAVGGYDGSVLNTVERLDPRAGKWEKVSPMSTSRSRLGSAVLHNHLYAAGGYKVSSVEKYNPVAEKWTAVADMKESRESVRLAVANGRLYAIGGNGDTDQETVEIFDIERNHWEHHSYLNEGRWRPDVGVIQLS